MFLTGARVHHTIQFNHMSVFVSNNGMVTLVTWVSSISCIHVVCDANRIDTKC